MILPEHSVAIPPTTTEWRSCISGLVNLDICRHSFDHVASIVSSAAVEILCAPPPAYTMSILSQPEVRA